MSLMLVIKDYWEAGITCDNRCSIFRDTDPLSLSWPFRNLRLKGKNILEVL
jgi:hypothetical protein